MIQVFRETLTVNTAGVIDSENQKNRVMVNCVHFDRYACLFDISKKYAAC